MKARKEMGWEREEKGSMKVSGVFEILRKIFERESFINSLGDFVFLITEKQAISFCWLG